MPKLVWVSVDEPTSYYTYIHNINTYAQYLHVCIKLVSGRMNVIQNRFQKHFHSDQTKHNKRSLLLLVVTVMQNNNNNRRNDSSWIIDQTTDESLFGMVVTHSLTEPPSHTNGTTFNNTGAHSHRWRYCVYNILCSITLHYTKHYNRR